MQTPTDNKHTLVRGLSLAQATAINMIDMVGIGPFVTIPFIVGIMQGPASIFAWLLGVLLSFTDGMVWAELGAKWPEAGGQLCISAKAIWQVGAFNGILVYMANCHTGPIGCSKWRYRLLTISHLSYSA